MKSISIQPLVPDISKDNLWEIIDDIIDVYKQEAEINKAMEQLDQ